MISYNMIDSPKLFPPLKVPHMIYLSPAQYLPTPFPLSKTHLDPHNTCIQTRLSSIHFWSDIEPKDVNEDRDEGGYEGCVGDYQYDFFPLLSDFSRVLFRRVRSGSGNRSWRCVSRKEGLEPLCHPLPKSTQLALVRSDLKNCDARHTRRQAQRQEEPLHPSTFFSPPYSPNTSRVSLQL